MLYISHRTRATKPSGTNSFRKPYLVLAKQSPALPSTKYLNPELIVINHPSLHPPKSPHLPTYLSFLLHFLTLRNSVQPSLPQTPFLLPLFPLPFPNITSPLYVTSSNQLTPLLSNSTPSLLLQSYTAQNPQLFFSPSLSPFLNQLLSPTHSHPLTHSFNKPIPSSTHSLPSPPPKPPLHHHQKSAPSQIPIPETLACTVQYSKK